MHSNPVLGCDGSVADLDVIELTAAALDRKTLTAGSGTVPGRAHNGTSRP